MHGSTLFPQHNFSALSYYYTTYQAQLPPSPMSKMVSGEGGQLGGGGRKAALSCAPAEEFQMFTLVVCS